LGFLGWKLDHVIWGSCFEVRVADTDDGDLGPARAGVVLLRLILRGRAANGAAAGARVMFVMALLLVGCSANDTFKARPLSPVTKALLAQFAAMDADGDGKVSFDQATDYHKQYFTDNDKNHDSLLVATEVPLLAVGPAETADGFIQRFDRNGDKKLNVEEFLVRVNTFFLRDHNGDGILTAEELQIPPRQRRGSKKGGKGSSGGRGGGKGRGGGGGGRGGY
jgi:uncharacterized membrane protein YgcG